MYYIALHGESLTLPFNITLPGLSFTLTQPDLAVVDLTYILQDMYYMYCIACVQLSHSFSFTLTHLDLAGVDLARGKHELQGNGGDDAGGRCGKSPRKYIFVEG